MTIVGLSLIRFFALKWDVPPLSTPISPLERKEHRQADINSGDVTLPPAVLGRGTCLCVTLPLTLSRDTA